MIITERQENLLDKIVKEYIDSAIPVSSQLLGEKHNLGVSSATLRIEMQKLTDQDFLCQPYTSAGRIPTDKGYRFFVDKLFEKGFSKFNDKKNSEILKKARKEIENSLKFTQVVTKILADNSSNLGLSYLFGEEILWREGWEDILEEPEFREADFASRFAKMLNCFEENIEKIATDPSLETKVYIGKENPVFKNKDFSIIVSKFSSPDLNCEGIFAILGPKRMHYNKNISIINLLTQSLREN